MPSRTTDGDQVPEIPPSPLKGEANAAGNPRVMRRAGREGVVGVRERSVDVRRRGMTIGSSGRRLARPPSHAEGKRRLEGKGIGEEEEKGGNGGRGGGGVGAEARPTRWR